MNTRRLSLLAVMLALIGPAQLLANPPDSQKKLDQALRKVLTSKKGTGTNRVIIQFNREHESDVLALLKNDKGSLVARHRLVSAFTVKVNAKDLELLSQCDYVKSISLDADVHGGATALDAPAAINGALRTTLGLGPTSPTGSTVGVAIIDSGIADSPEFAGRITAFYDFTKGGIPASPSDGYGHGTHVAGLVAGNGVLSDGQYQGVAPGARLIGLKVLDATGGGHSSDVMLALEFAVLHKAALGIDVVNMSLGHPPLESADTDPLAQAVNAAAAAGLTVVVSAGNIGINPRTGKVGYAGITSPGNASGALTIGAADTRDTPEPIDDTIAPYSSRGPSWFDGHAKPDVVAPGHRLVSATSISSTLYDQHPTLRVTASGGQYLRLCGTSMAAGVASGIVALLIDTHRAAHPQAPALTPNIIKGILQYTAVPLPGFDVLTQGMGETNPVGAMTFVQALQTNAAGLHHLGAIVPFTGYGPYLVGWSGQILWGNTILSGQDIIWSEAADVVWGDSVAWGQAADVVWGDSVVWGQDIVWSEAADVIWGENVVWGDDIVWGEAADIVWGEAADIVWGESVLWSDGEGTASTGGSH